MKGWKWLAAAVVVLIAGGGWYVMAERPPEVRTAKVTRGEVIDAVYATGEVRALTRAMVSNEAPGRVVEVLVDAGDTVSPGAVLARLESTTVELNREMAEQSLARAKSSWEEAKRHLERMSALKGQGAVSVAEYDAAARSEERAAADYKKQEAALKSEQDRVVKTEVTSVLGGLLISRSVEPGEYAPAGRTMFTVIEPSTLMIVVDVDETEVSKIAAGQEVKIALDAFPGERFTGVVDRVIPKIDGVTRTGEVRISLAEGREKLREGMSATVNVLTRRVEDALTVPRDAVIKERESSRVFTIDGDGKLRSVEFTAGAMDESRVEVKSGDLAQGREVVLDPSADWTDGMAVRREAD